MNTPHDPPDLLLQSLADDAADLPVRAAIEARQRNAHRVQNRQWLALAVTVSFVGVVAWALFPSRDVRHATVAMHPVTPDSSPDPAPSAPEPPPTPPAPEPLEYVKVRTEEESLPLPTGLDQEQQELVKAAGDLPLLLVRDARGKVTRIHVIER